MPIPRGQVTRDWFHANGVVGKMTDAEARELDDIGIFIADLHVRRRVPLSNRERKALRELANVARSANGQYGLNPHEADKECKCGNCKRGV